VLGVVAAAAAIPATWFAWPKANLSYRVSETSKATAEPGEPGVVGAFLQAPEQREMPLTFSDGTVLRLAPRTQARVSSVSTIGATVLLESGALHADVIHRVDTRWSVAAGPFAIQVTGTKFLAEWDPGAESVVVTLEEGSVIVTGCTLGSKGRRIVAGERLTSSCKGATAVESAAPSSVQSAEPPPALAPSALPDSKEGATKVVAPEPYRGTDVDLLRAADEDRFAGRTEQAKAKLKLARTRFPGTAVAASAAFALGRLAFDQRGSYAEAGDWFERYLEESPSGELAREALGRAIESRARAGESARAQVLAARYLAFYPDGPHSTFARRILKGEAP
jgi:TolA-binding protein